MIDHVDNNGLVWLLVENNYCSSCVSHEISVMWYIIKFLSCNTPIDDVEYHTTYFDVVVWRYWYMPEEVRNITTQPILGLAVDPYGILIGKVPKFFCVTWVQ